MQIGDRVKDRINSFTGIITGTTEYINGCRQHMLKPERLDKDGKVQDAFWIDEQHLILVDEQVLNNPFAGGKGPTAGGPDVRVSP